MIVISYITQVLWEKTHKESQNCLQSVLITFTPLVFVILISNEISGNVLNIEIAANYQVFMLIFESLMHKLYPFYNDIKSCKLSYNKLSWINMLVLGYVWTL